MIQIMKEVQFYIASTGEVIHTISVDENISDDELENIRQKISFDKGIPMNSIGIMDIGE